MCGEDERFVCAGFENGKPEVFEEFRHCEIVVRDRECL